MAVAKESSKVKILLEGKLEDGTVFDKTEKDKPIDFIVGEGRMLPKNKECSEEYENWRNEEHHIKT